MLRIDKKDDDTLTLVSDDEDGENVLLEEVFDFMGYPELAELWSEADEVIDGDSGFEVWRMDVPPERWPDLMEALDGMDHVRGSELAGEVRAHRIERDQASA